jgi:2-keto-4-pentenoate hydratase
MQAIVLDELATALARNRKTGTFSVLQLDGLRSRQDAEAVQAAALDAYAEDFVGYALIGTSEVCRHMLGLDRPVQAAIPDTSLYAGGSRIRLPQGMIGAQCELAFTLGRSFPEIGETIDRRSVADAILACQPAIGLLGRRTRPGPDNELTAIADFALHVATICGPPVEPHDKEALDRSVMTARIDGTTVITAKADMIMGHPLNALVWLAREFFREGKQLNAGDIVTTGSCAPILQILPGQQLTVEFEGVGVATCSFD